MFEHTGHCMDVKTGDQFNFRIYEIRYSWIQEYNKFIFFRNSKINKNYFYNLNIIRIYLRLLNIQKNKLII